MIELDPRLLKAIAPMISDGVAAIRRGDQSSRRDPIFIPVSSYRNPLPRRLPNEDFRAWRKRQYDLDGHYLSLWSDFDSAVSRLESAEIAELWFEARFVGLAENLIRLSVAAEFFLEGHDEVEFLCLELGRPPRVVRETGIDLELLGRIFQVASASDPAEVVDAKDDANPLVREVARELWLRYPEAETGLIESQRYALESLSAGGPEMVARMFCGFDMEISRQGRAVHGDVCFFNDILHLWQDGAIERVELGSRWPTSTFAITDLGRQVLRGEARVKARSYWIGGVNQLNPEVDYRTWYRSDSGEALLLDHPFEQPISG